MGVLPGNIVKYLQLLYSHSKQRSVKTHECLVPWPATELTYFDTLNNYSMLLLRLLKLTALENISTKKKIIKKIADHNE